MVALRLLLPFSIESNLSLIPSTETVPQEILQYEGTLLQNPAYLDVVSNPNFPGSVSVPAGQSVEAVQWQMVDMTFLWLVGIAALLLYTAISYLSLRRKLATAVILREDIFQSEHASSPFVLGIIKPRIYLPYHMDEDTLHHVISHEQAHIRRRDHWWKPLGFLLLTIHWFNPVMWLAYVLLCRDIELACDESVIRELGHEQRADYTEALVSCSIHRRRIAACPLAFGEVGVKERVKSVMNYRKPAFWVIVLSILACAAVAVCFLTDPKQDSYTLRIVVPAGSQEEFVYSDEEVSTIKNSIKIWAGDGLGDTEVLLSPVNETTETGYTATYLTHGMPVEFDAEKDTWFKVGVNIQNPTDQDLIVYVEVEGVAVRIEDEANSATKWFDYLEPNAMVWNGCLEINLPEFPDVTFRWYPEKMEAVTEDGITPLYTGMPIWNAYFCDFTGDGLPELCSTVSWGSGMIDNRVMIYDYANGASYEMADRGKYDFTLRLNEEDGYLYVDKQVHQWGKLVASGRLAFKDNCIQIIEETTVSSLIIDIVDPTKGRNFSYDSAIEKIFEDEQHDYFFGGTYSEHVIVHYADGSTEDIVSALNSGRASIADLDRFEINYWTAPKADSLDAAIRSAIIAYNEPAVPTALYPEGLFHCASFVLLQQVELSFDSDPPRPNQVTVYGMAMDMTFRPFGSSFSKASGSHTAVAITFEVENGEYRLIEYWEADRGANYAPSIREKFPDEIEEKALDTLQYIDMQTQECYAQAEEWISSL